MTITNFKDLLDLILRVNNLEIKVEEITLKNVQLKAKFDKPNSKRLVKGK